MLRPVGWVPPAKIDKYAPAEERIVKISKQEAQLFALVEQLGYSLTPSSKIVKDLAHSIASRMTMRVGIDVYQMPAFKFNIPKPNFPAPLAENLFPIHRLTINEPSHKMWRFNTVAELLPVLVPWLANESSFAFAGITRAIKPPSAPFIRVLATLMTLEVSHVTREGGDKLFVNFSYVLTEESGDVHPPKDELRIEIAIGDEEMTALREQILADAMAMSEKQYPLSSAWFRQLGMEEHALYIQSLEENDSQQSALFSAAPPPPAGQKKKRKKKPVMNSFDARLIVEQEKRGGRRGYWVEWEGYRPSWEAYRVEGRGEPGDPLITWEPAPNLAGTQALEAWEQQQTWSSSAAGHS